jgi:probable rRNA maturation factor
LGAWLASAAPARARGEVALALVSDARMRVLNRAYRGMDYATDVLSFPTDAAQAKVSARRTKSNVRTKNGVRTLEASAAAETFLGDIVIASGVAARQARTAGHSLQTELRVLALHGLLHLLGYDHETDDGKMARSEARLRRKAGLREGLIEREGRPAKARR